MSGPVLVTGARGFIGSSVCRLLAAEGHVVHAVSRGRGPDATGVRWWEADLADERAARKLVERTRPERIIHLAGVPVASRDLAMVPPTFSSNLATTVHVLHAAALVDCRCVVLAGSLETPRPGEEGAAPSSPYAASKWAAETYARMFRHLYGLPVLVARIFMTYGPGQSDDKLIPYVARCLLRGESPRLTSGVRPVDWVHVEDVARGLVRASRHEAAGFSEFDLGSGELVTIRDLVTRLFRIAGADAEPEFGSVPDRADETVRKADVARTRDLLGWAPEIPLDEGLRQTFGWIAARHDPGA